MSVFGAYSSYYDLLYRDKDYPGEAVYVADLIHRIAPQAKSLLELGCGTGAHSSLLAAKGWRVHGIDRSEEMLAAAQARINTVDPDVAALLSYEIGDVRNYRYVDTFDAVASLFHVVSYQTENSELDDLFATSAAHLSEGGVFVFDFWYGPAVLSDPPVVRVKRLEDEHNRILRIAEPVLHPNLNCVDVNYQIIVKNRATGAVEEMSETHPMRYLFLPEVALLLEKHGFSSWTAEEWMTGRQPSVETWGICVVAKK